MTPAGQSTMTDAEATAAAIRNVEEEMLVLAGHVRAGLRDAALGIDPALTPFGLTLLRLLNRCGPTHAGAAAEALFVDRSVISRQARQLEALGLTTLEVDPNDRRARYLALTPEAVRKLAGTAANDRVLINKSLGSWSPADLNQFAGYIARLNNAEA